MIIRQWWKIGARGLGGGPLYAIIILEDAEIRFSTFEVLCKSEEVEVDCLKWDLGGWLGGAELLLLLELLVAGLDGDGQADLGLLL